MSVTLVRHSQRLVDAMGCWPLFHDAHVLDARREGGDIDLVLHVFNMTSRLDESGYFVLEDHHRVTLALCGVVEDGLPLVYDGDCLDRLLITPELGLVRVDILSHLDTDGSVLCRAVEVREVLPCDARGEPA